MNEPGLEGWTIVEDNCDGGGILLRSPNGARRRVVFENKRCDELEAKVEQLKLKLYHFSSEVQSLEEKLSEIQGDTRVMAAFLMSDKMLGESTWKSPFISAGSEIHKIARKYEGRLGHS